MSHPSEPPRTHPPENRLAAHAAGQLDWAGRAVLEAHLAHCPVCRTRLARDLAPGGRLLAEAPEAPPPPSLLEGLMQRIAAEPAGDWLDEGVPLPAAVRAEIPRQSSLGWQRVGTGSSEVAILLADPEAEVQLLMARAPGAAEPFPRHVHLGEEELVVLAGGYSDFAGHFEVGDFARYEPGTEHGPVPEEGGPCWILSRIEKGVRFLE